MSNQMKIFAGTPGRALAQQICGNLSMDLGKANVGRFADGEVRVELQESVRGADVYIINPTNPPDEHRMEMIVLTKACLGSSAGRVTCVIPYLGYNRQDRKDRPRVAVCAEIAIDQICRSGCRHVLLLDVHSEATLSIFHNHDIVVDHLYSSIIAADYIKQLFGEAQFTPASTDHGGAARVRAYAKRLGTNETVIFDKQRVNGEVDGDQVIIIGNVKGRNLLFVDDMIDTAGTLCKDAVAAKKEGAERIIAYAAHGLLSGNAIERLDDSPIEELIISNSIPQDEKKLAAAKRIKITVLSVHPLLARAIHNIHNNDSVSELIR